MRWLTAKTKPADPAQVLEGDATAAAWTGITGLYIWVRVTLSLCVSGHVHGWAGSPPFPLSNISPELSLTQPTQPYDGCSNPMPGKDPLEHAWGRTHLEERLLGLDFRISPDAFFQACVGVSWRNEESVVSGDRNARLIPRSLTQRFLSSHTQTHTYTHRPTRRRPRCCTRW